MKNKIIRYLIVLCLLLFLVACSDTSAGKKGKADIAPFEFNDKGLKVITTFLNNYAGTMSTLYGNTAALKMAITGTGKHVSGEAYCLVTRKQAENKFWYGSIINGAYLTIESVTIFSLNNTLTFNYRLIKGTGIPDEEQRTRINFILGLRPSVFP